MAAFLNALVFPERAFDDTNTFRVPRTLIIIAVFLLHLAGSELVSHFYATPYVAGLTLQQIELAGPQFTFGPQHSNRTAGGAPPDRGARVAASITNPTVRSVGIVVRSLLFLAQPLITWWLLVTFVQFLGGEEKRTSEGERRDSRYLVWYAWTPLAVRRLSEGLLIQFQDPASAWSSLSLEHYRLASGVSFSLASLLRLPRLPEALSYLASNLTDPFYLWFLFILVSGGRTVFRLSRRSALSVAAFTILALYLEKVGFAAIGLSTGV